MRLFSVDEEQTRFNMRSDEFDERYSDTWYIPCFYVGYDFGNRKETERRQKLRQK